MASIKKLPNGTYQATIYVGRDAQGKQIRKYVTRSGWKECRKAAREMEQEIAESKYVDVDKIRFSTLMDKWLDLNQNTIAPSTYLSYKMYVDVHFKPYFKNIRIDKLTEIHIKSYMNEKLKVLSHTTVRKHMLILNRMLEDILKHKNPAKDIKVPQPDEYTPYVLTDDEFKLIHESVKDTRDEPIVLLAAWCGLRRGEIFALEWEDIDFKKGTININKSRSITEEGFKDKTPKSKNGLRTIVMPEELAEVLKQYRNKKGKISGHLFEVRPDTYTNYFKSFIEKNNLPPIRFHDLRHYHASWLYNQGIPDLYAAQRLGHDIHVLKGIYQHLNVDRKTSIDEAIRGINKPNNTAQNTAQKS